jgi:eukaryotic-like serine/threonine-protein kinase
MLKKIIHTLTIFFLFTHVYNCNPHPKIKKVEENFQNYNWPIFRGSRNLDGQAKGKFTEKPILRWSYKTKGSIESSAVINFDSIYIGSTDGFLYCLDIKNGDLNWTFDSGDTITAPPLFLNDKIIIGNHTGILFALNSQGKIIWQFATKEKITGSANYIFNKGKTNLIISSYDYFIYCLDLDSGQLIWKFETGNYINGSPTVFKNQIMFAGCDGVFRILSAEGEQIKEINIDVYIASSTAVSDQDAIAYIGTYDGSFLGIDLQTTRIIWSYQNKKKTGSFLSSACISETTVFAGSRDHLLLALNRNDGTLKWQFRALDRIDSSPIFVNEKLLFGSDDGIFYMINADNGEKMWSYEIGAPISGSPAINKGLVVIASTDGKIYCFGAAH